MGHLIVMTDLEETETPSISSIQNKRRTSCYHCGEQCPTLEALGEHLNDIHSERALSESLPGPISKKTPFPHQLEAVEAIQKGFVNNDRLTVVMACGTGKSLTALWSAECIKAQHVVIFASTLGLIRQTVLEWHAQSTYKHFLCVCSDSTVSHEGIPHVTSKNMGCPVTTRASDVIDFLEKHKGESSAIFCTYHSSPLLTKMEGQAFDLGIFDEAHRTAVPSESHFSTGLENEDIPIQKRLFMTATPRYHECRLDGVSMHSMDDRKTYGPVGHVLSFNEAVNRGIICDFKVTIALIEGESREGVPVGVKLQVASLAKAIREHSVHKLITFHSSIREATQFAESVPLRKALPGFQTYEVHAKLSAKQRSDAINEFTSATKGIITNVRCLTEGIDIPSVDMVAFMNPRRSQVDITQAIGRAVRKYPGKQVGHVFIPLLFDKDLITDQWDIVPGFDEMILLIASLKQHDGNMREFMEKSLGELSVEHQPKGVSRKQILGNTAVVEGPSNLVADFTKHLAIRVLGGMAARWEMRYEELRAFKKNHGHTNVIRSCKGAKHRGLAIWIQAQRTKRRRGVLGKDEIQRLDQLGFTWSTENVPWKVRHQQLINLKKRFGAIDFYDDDAVPEYTELLAWVRGQQLRNRKGNLPPNIKKALTKLGLGWGREVDWERKYHTLKMFHKNYGHIRLPLRGVFELLRRWVEFQQELATEGVLPTKHIGRLETLGVQFKKP